MTSPANKLRDLGRASSAPLREYFNAHFEMIKDEVRRVGALTREGSADQIQHGNHLAELSNVVAETQLYQSRLIGELRREVVALRSEIEQLTNTSAQLAAVIAAMTLTDQSPE